MYPDELTTRAEELGIWERIDQTVMAALDVLFRFEFCGVGHISSARVFKGLQHSGSLVLI